MFAVKGEKFVQTRGVGVAGVADVAHNNV